jgi:hypothetical protein
LIGIAKTGNALGNLLIVVGVESGCGVGLVLRILQG